ncbi:hypothetical protein MP228_000441 [Amoeboaphelidium protococcarum]|nr:hypothetical protein MP228_000441 [Amoeboaphelidium protococcarum]
MDIVKKQLSSNIGNVQNYSLSTWLLQQKHNPNQYVQESLKFIQDGDIPVWVRCKLMDTLTDVDMLLDALLPFVSDCHILPDALIRVLLSQVAKFGKSDQLPLNRDPLVRIASERPECLRLSLQDGAWSLNLMKYVVVQSSYPLPCFNDIFYELGDHYNSGDFVGADTRLRFSQFLADYLRNVPLISKDYVKRQRMYRMLTLDQNQDALLAELQLIDFKSSIRSGASLTYDLSRLRSGHQDNAIGIQLMLCDLLLDTNSSLDLINVIIEQLSKFETLAMFVKPALIWKSFQVNFIDSALSQQCASLLMNKKFIVVEQPSTIKLQSNYATHLVTKFYGGQQDELDDQSILSYLTSLLNAENLDQHRVLLKKCSNQQLSSDSLSGIFSILVYKLGQTSDIKLVKYIITESLPQLLSMCNQDGNLTGIVIKFYLRLLENEGNGLYIYALNGLLQCYFVNNRVWNYLLDVLHLLLNRTPAVVIKSEFQGWKRKKFHAALYSANLLCHQRADQCGIQLLSLMFQLVENYMDDLQEAEKHLILDSVCSLVQQSIVEVYEIWNIMIQKLVESVHLEDCGEDLRSSIMQFYGLIAVTTGEQEPLMILRNEVIESIILPYSGLVEFEDGTCPDVDQFSCRSLAQLPSEFLLERLNLERVELCFVTDPVAVQPVLENLIKYEIDNMRRPVFKALKEATTQGGFKSQTHYHQSETDLATNAQRMYDIVMEQFVQYWDFKAPTDVASGLVFAYSYSSMIFSERILLALEKKLEQNVTNTLYDMMLDMALHNLPCSDIYVTITAGLPHFRQLFTVFLPKFTQSKMGDYEIVGVLCDLLKVLLFEKFEKSNNVNCKINVQFAACAFVACGVQLYPSASGPLLQLILEFWQRLVAREQIMTESLFCSIIVAYAAIFQYALDVNENLCFQLLQMLFGRSQKSKQGENCLFYFVGSCAHLISMDQYKSLGFQKLRSLFESLKSDSSAQLKNVSTFDALSMQKCEYYLIGMGQSIAVNMKLAYQYKEFYQLAKQVLLKLNYDTADANQLEFNLAAIRVCCHLITVFSETEFEQADSLNLIRQAIIILTNNTAYYGIMGSLYRTHAVMLRSLVVKSPRYEIDFYNVLTEIQSDLSIAKYPSVLREARVEQLQILIGVSYWSHDVDVMDENCHNNLQVEGQYQQLASRALNILFRVSGFSQSGDKHKANADLKAVRASIIGVIKFLSAFIALGVPSEQLSGSGKTDMARIQTMNEPFDYSRLAKDESYLRLVYDTLQSHADNEDVIQCCLQILLSFNGPLPFINWSSALRICFEHERLISLALRFVEKHMHYSKSVLQFALALFTDAPTQSSDEVLQWIMSSGLEQLLILANQSQVQPVRVKLILYQFYSLSDNQFGTLQVVHRVCKAQTLIKPLQNMLVQFFQERLDSLQFSNLTLTQAEECKYHARLIAGIYDLLRMNGAKNLLRDIPKQMSSEVVPLKHFVGLCFLVQDFITKSKILCSQILNANDDAQLKAFKLSVWISTLHLSLEQYFQISDLFYIYWKQCQTGEHFDDAWKLFVQFTMVVLGTCAPQFTGNWQQWCKHLSFHDPQYLHQLFKIEMVQTLSQANQQTLQTFMSRLVKIFRLGNITNAVKDDTRFLILQLMPSVEEFQSIVDKRSYLQLFDDL